MGLETDLHLVYLYGQCRSTCTSQIDPSSSDSSVTSATTILPWEDAIAHWKFKPKKASSINLKYNLLSIYIYILF